MAPKKPTNKKKKRPELTKGIKTDVQNTIDKLMEKDIIDGKVLKPWTLDKIIQAAPVLEKIAIKFKANGVTWKVFFEDTNKIIFMILPELPDLFSVSLELPKEEMLELSPDVATVLALKIIKQNMTYLKNFFGPVMQMILEMTQKIRG